MTHRLTLLALVLALGSAVACKDDPPPPAPEPPPKKEEVEEPEPVPEYLAIREIYGLPIPSEITDARVGVHSYEVGTRLTMEEIEGFFKKRLVDYEYVWLSPNDLEIIGLRSTMPRITVRRRSNLGPRRIRYLQQIGALQREQLAKNPVKPLKEGDKVDSTLSDGRKLAPGAVYGQPYTPKPGDPLYTEGNKANFGKPFGKWVLN